MKTPLPSRLIGRTIKDVNFRPFDDGRGGTACNPIITFTDGTMLTFIVQETEIVGGEYGIAFCISRPGKSSGKPKIIGVEL